MDDVVRRADNLVRQNQYLTLATADSRGTPWASTVWYAAWWSEPGPEGGLGLRFLWLSWPQAQHSQNLLQQPEVAFSIFDSGQPAGTGDGLQLAARAEQVPDELVDDAAAVFSEASVAAGGGTWARAQVEPPAVPRLYVARPHRAYLLGNGGRVDVLLA